ncbi:MAG TPA: hypothetical protein VGG25_21490 [Streptosporangiaceae bacterium]
MPGQPDAQPEAQPPEAQPPPAALPPGTQPPEVRPAVRPEVRWAAIPPAPPPHGTVLSWHKGCRCTACEESFEDFRHELEVRARAWREDAPPTPRRLSADERAHLEFAVQTRTCPRCGALPSHRCRNPHFPLHFAQTHPDR